MLIHSPVKSSMIKSVAYDEDRKILEIKFKNNDIYQYHNVPSTMHKRLISSPSIGKFLANHISPIHKYHKI